MVRVANREGERPVSLAELLASDEPVRVSEALTITPSARSDAVSGGPNRPGATT